MIVVNMLNKLINRFSLLLKYVFRKIFPLGYPENKNNEVYIHLGCGDVNSPEFINVDTRFFSHVHRISRVESLKFFQDNFADLIYTSHTLEHIPMRKVKNTILEWKRILKPGGVLRISVPDFDKIIKIYSECGNSIDAIWQPLLGGQEYKENNHFSVFNFEYLKKLLETFEFKEIRIWQPDKVKHHDFDDWASKHIAVNEKKFPISINIEAKK